MIHTSEVVTLSYTDIDNSTEPDADTDTETDTVNDSTDTSDAGEG